MITNKSTKAATHAVTLLKNHLQHEGEEFIQKKRHVFDQVSGVVANITQDSMPNQHSVFFSNLPYFAIATVDLKGRPWSTIVVGSPNTVVLATAPDTLSISALLSSGDPVVKCIEQAEREKFQFFAGLGVDFSNRRRNKVGGYISDWRYEKSGTSTQLDLTVVTNDNLGNCPKYITVRDLSLKERIAEVIVNSPRFDQSDQEEPNSSLLTDDEKSVINQASTLFIASRHFSHDTDSDMGLNHRGGPPGFTRVYEENGQTYVVIPDYSGNRFYQSLGNVESDRVAGIVFPRFTNGDILHITGEAENLYDDEAEEIMPRVSLLTRIRVTGHVFIKGGMNLEMKGPEQYSPYNPQLRLLKRELEERGKSLHNASQHNFATLVSIEKLSRLISRFTFKLDEPVSYIPGSYAVFDFTDHIKKSYKHMNNANPKSVNDDLIRTWTISSSPPVDSLTGQFLPSDTLSCTIKHVEKGAVTPFLHSQVVGEKSSSLRLRLSGIGMSFSCFSPPRNIVPEKMLWIAGGVGITPFLSMWSGIVSRELNVDIAVLYSARGDESEITSMFKDHPLIKHYSVFDSTNLKEATSGNYSAFNRRVSKIDIDSCEALHERVVFICGPVSFMNDISLWLQQTGMPAANINRESFDF